MRANAALRHNQTTEKLQKLQQEGQQLERELEQIKGEYRTLEGLIALDDQRAIAGQRVEATADEASVIPPIKKKEKAHV